MSENQTDAVHPPTPPAEQKPRPIKPLMTAIGIGAIWGAVEVPHTLEVAGLVEFGLTMLAVIIAAWAVALVALDFLPALVIYVLRRMRPVLPKMRERR